MSHTSLLDVRGVQLEVGRWPGRKSPILLLHEGLGSLAMWRDFPAALAGITGHEVLAWSRQGHGGSSPLPGPRDPDYMHREAMHVPALMDATGIEQAHLFGHSDGGSIAIIVASMFPARVSSLMLEAPHVHVEDITIESIAAAEARYEGTDLPRRLGRYHSDADLVFRNWAGIWLDERFRNWNIETFLLGIIAPALLIQGLDDEYGTLNQLDRIERVLPMTRRLELHGCGHAPHRDQPQTVLAAMRSFIEAVDP